MKSPSLFYSFILFQLLISHFSRVCSLLTKNYSIRLQCYGGELSISLKSPSLFYYFILFQLLISHSSHICSLFTLTSIICLIYYISTIFLLLSSQTFNVCTVLLLCPNLHCILSLNSYNVNLCCNTLHYTATRDYTCLPPNSTCII